MYKVSAGRLIASRPLGFSFNENDLVDRKYVDDNIKAADALILKGTVNADTGLITSSDAAVNGKYLEGPTTFLTNYLTGWTFKVDTAGTLTGIGALQVGDMVVAMKDYDSSFQPLDFHAFQTNIEFSTIGANLAQIPSVSEISFIQINADQTVSRSNATTFRTAIGALSSSSSSTQSGYFGNIYLKDDSTPSHYLEITNSANLTADRTLSINVNDVNRTITLGGNLDIDGNFTILGGNHVTLRTTATTDITLPITGTLVTRTASETLTNKTLTDPFITHIKGVAGTPADLWSENTSGEITVGSGLTSGTFTLGGAVQTGTITIGRSTGTNTIEIGAGATASAKIQTINLGTNGLSGSTTTIAIGSTLGTFSTNINGILKTSSVANTLGSFDISGTAPAGSTRLNYNGHLYATRFYGALIGNADTASKSTNLVGGNGTTLLGSIPYQSAADTTTLLAPNVSTTAKYLRQVGNGTNGAAPTWGQIAYSEISGTPTIPTSFSISASSNILAFSGGANSVTFNVETTKVSGKFYRHATNPTADTGTEANAVKYEGWMYATRFEGLIDGGTSW